MTGKNLLRKRGVLITLAVVALMALTAGTVVAAATKSHKVEAVGGVVGVGLNIGGTVESDFKIKDGVIKSVKIETDGEGFGGGIVAMTACTEKGKHSVGACTDAGVRPTRNS